MDLNSLISNLSIVLWPIKWVVEAVLVGFHTLLTAIGFAPGDGLTWILSILGLVLVARSALIPVFVRQIKSQRRMLEVAPQIKKIQDKYKGKKDQFSREAMSRETMELYKRTGTNPLSSCLPLLIQMPIFLSLTATLNAAQQNQPLVGLLNNTSSDGVHKLSYLFGHAELFGIPLHESISTSHWALNVTLLAAGMIILMSATQFITQLQIMSKNQSPEMKASPTYKQQRIMLYILPFIFIFSGYSFALGVMFYWVFGNLWTMGQQFLVIRSMPVPGSDAALAREARLARQRQRRPQIASAGASTGASTGSSTGGIGGISIVEEPKKVTTQRTQPVGKTRAKKTGNQK
jgi:YidC/Oxa1 family membrane protein insertase